jgi:O-antigen ligase
MNIRRVAYLLSLVFIFLLPWEDSISTSGWGSLARVAGLVLAALWLVTILVEGRFRKLHLFHFLVLLFFLWNFVSVFWSFDASGTRQRITTYSQIFLLVLVYWEMFQKPQQLRMGAQAYVLGSYVLVGGTLYNYVNGIVAVAYEGRYSAPGVNAVDMALMLIMGMPMALYLVLTAGHRVLSRILQLANLAYLPLAMYAVLLTGSRTSLLAAIPFVLYVALTPLIRPRHRVLIFVGLAALLVALIPFIPQTLISRLGTLGSSIAGEDIGGRVALWREAISILAIHPLLGTGGGTLDGIIGSAAHNTYVSIATETGMVGFTLFLAILVVVLFETWRAPVKNRSMWMAVLATWAIGVLSLSWDFRKLTWLILGLAVVAGNLRSQSVPEPAISSLAAGQEPGRSLSGSSTEADSV